MSRRRAAVAGLLVGLGLAFLACGEDGGTAPSTSPADAAPIVTPDAAAPAVEAGDVPPADAGSDGHPTTLTPPDAAPPGRGVRVTVVGATGKPQAGVGVILHDAEGKLVEATSTNAAGEARFATTPPAAMVTVLDLSPQRWLLTYVGVEDGDALVASLRSIPPPTGSVGAFKVSFPVDPDPDPISTSYTASLNGLCNAEEPSTPISITAEATCTGESNVVLGERLASGVPTGYAFVRGLRSPDNGISDAMLSEWHLPTMVTPVALNLPPDATVTAFATQVAGGHFFPVKPSGTDFPIAGAFADSLVVGMAVERALFKAHQSLGITHHLSLGSKLEIDFGAGSLPFINSASATNDVAQPEVTWTSAVPFDRADMGTLALHVAQSTTSDEMSWAVVFPPSLTKVRLPALPETMFGTGALKARLAQVTFLESSGVGGYAGAKTLAIDVLKAPRVLQEPPAENGTVRFSSLSVY